MVLFKYAVQVLLLIYSFVCARCICYVVCTCIEENWARVIVHANGGHEIGGIYGGGLATSDISFSFLYYFDRFAV
jgi:hypothetical protein